MRDVTAIRRRKFAPAAGLAVVTAAGLFLTACGGDDGGQTDAGVSAHPDEAAVTGELPAVTETEENTGDAPQPTPGSSPDQATQATGGQPQPDPAPADRQQGPDQVPMADYTVALNGQNSMTCMFREGQEVDGFDWGCVADNFQSNWESTSPDDLAAAGVCESHANNVAYRAGGDPALIGFCGNPADANPGGALDDGSVSTVGDRFTVNLSQPDAALITADGVTARVTTDSYDIVG